MPKNLAQQLGSQTPQRPQGNAPQQSGGQHAKQAGSQAFKQIASSISKPKHGNKYDEMQQRIDEINHKIRKLQNQLHDEQKEFCRQVDEEVKKVDEDYDFQAGPWMRKIANLRDMIAEEKETRAVLESRAAIDFAKEQKAMAEKIKIDWQTHDSSNQEEIGKINDEIERLQDTYKDLERKNVEANIAREIFEDMEKESLSVMIKSGEAIRTSRRRLQHIAFQYDPRKAKAAEAREEAKKAQTAKHSEETKEGKAVKKEDRSKNQNRPQGSSGGNHRR